MTDEHEHLYLERNYRLRSLSNRSKCLEDDMCVAFELPPMLISNIRMSTKLFFHECLCEYFQRKFFDGVPIEDFVELHKDSIRELPNITPNGLVLPKHRTMCSYNRVLKDTSSIIEFLGLENTLESIHFPINVRLRHGTPKESTLSRPYASTKWHSDIWAGESAHNVMLHIPLFGNFRDNGVLVASSQDGFFPNFVKHLDDYDEGKSLTENTTPRPMRMNVGEIYMLDSFLLHKSQIGDDGFRAILSFPVVPKMKLDSDIYHNPERDKNYLDAHEWMKIGKTKFVTTEDKLEKYNSGDVTKISYAGNYRICE